MKAGDTFWLTVLILLVAIFILVGMVIFMTIPKSGRREFWALGIMLLIQLLSDVSSIAGIFLFKQNMTVVINVMTLLRFVAVIMLYKSRIHWKNIDKLALTLIFSYLIFAFINLFFIQGLWKVNSYTWSFQNVCIIIISITYFYVLIQQLPTESITKLPMFWINTAMLIHHSGTFMVFIATDYLISVLNNNLISTYIIYNILALVFYGMLWRALLLIRAEHKPVSENK